MSGTRHFIETCVCGNVLSQCRCAGNKVQIRHSPCRCTNPGPGARTLAITTIPDGVTRQHYEERKRTGLPLLTSHERAQFGRRWQ